MRCMKYRLLLLILLICFLIELVYMGTLLLSNNINKKDSYYEKDEYTAIINMESTIDHMLISRNSILDKPNDFDSYGISKVDKVLSNKNSYYVLARGEIVQIKNMLQENLIILDDNGTEFISNRNDIELRPLHNQVSRSIISRRTISLSKLISYAYGLVGKPYVYGDTGKIGYDCSGFIYSLYLNKLGIALPRNSYLQANAGTEVAKSQLIPGDLLFFNTTGKKISHVGLYIGEGNMIHASSCEMEVRIDSIDSEYYNNRYVIGRRIVK